MESDAVNQWIGWFEGCFVYLRMKKLNEYDM